MVVGAQDGVGVDGVEFFLRLDRRDGADHAGLFPGVGDAEALDVVGDVVQQVGEECDLEQFVERDQSEACQVVVREPRWCSPIRLGPLSLHFNGLQCVGAQIWKAIRQGKCKWASRSGWRSWGVSPRLVTLPMVLRDWYGRGDGQECRQSDKGGGAMHCD